MNTIWGYLKLYSKVESKVKFSKLDEGIISFQLADGLKYNIKCFFVNNNYLQLDITADDEPNFNAIITHVNRLGEKEIIQMLSSILTHCECIKP